MCHDLISPIGAIQNGLELLEMAGSGGDISAEMALIKDSCSSAAARIRFFRVAFGGASEGQNVGTREILSTLEGICQGTRLEANWTSTEDAPRADVQLAYLAFQCCEAALPVGGTIQIDASGNGWNVTATGRKYKVDQPFWDHLNGIGDGEDIPAARIQFLMLPILAAARGRSIAAIANDDGIRIALT
jgi:histidine phosphotransferase ChpT